MGRPTPRVFGGIAVLATTAAVLAWSSTAYAICYKLPFDNPNLDDGWGSLCCGRVTPHRGVDFPQPSGTPIPAIGTGTVVVNQWSSEFAGNRAALVALNEVFDGRVVNLHAQGGNILSFAFHDALPDLHRDAWFDAAQALGLKLSIPLQRHARNLWRQNAEVLRSGRFRRLPR